MKTRTKQECYDAISKDSYQGPRRNFDFNTYVGIHQQAHQDLVRLGEPVPENKKVRDFLNGINDPQCANIKLNVLANEAFMNSFPQAINYIASAIDLITKNTSTTARQIADMHRNEARGRGRGRGRSPGRDGRGRGGRGRGRGRGRNSQGRGPHNQDNLTRSYSSEEWQNLTAAQRSQIYRERERLQTARTIATVLQEQQHENTQQDTNVIQNK